MQKLLRLSWLSFFLLTAILFLNGCGLLPDSFVLWEEAPPQETAAQAKSPKPANIQPRQAPSSRADRSENSVPKAAVRLKWLVPGEPVETYHLSYGNNPTNLDQHLTLKVEELKKSNDPQHGPVFVYDLRGISTSEDLFVSIRAENKSGLSAAANPIHIPAQVSR